MWAGFNTDWCKGGATTIDGLVSSDFMNDWRVGVPFSAPLSKMQALRLQFHIGLMLHLGLNYDSITVAYQYVFF